MQALTLIYQHNEDVITKEIPSLIDEFFTLVMKHPPTSGQPGESPAPVDPELEELSQKLEARVKQLTFKPVPDKDQLSPEVRTAVVEMEELLQKALKEGDANALASAHGAFAINQMKSQGSFINQLANSLLGSLFSSDQPILNQNPKKGSTPDEEKESPEAADLTQKENAKRGSAPSPDNTQIPARLYLSGAVEKLESDITTLIPEAAPPSLLANIQREIRHFEISVSSTPSFSNPMSPKVAAEIRPLAQKLSQRLTRHFENALSPSSGRTDKIQKALGDFIARFQPE